MSNRLATGLKKRWLIVGAIVLLAALGAGGYYGYQWYQQYQRQHATVSQASKDQAAAYHFSGSQDLAARYIELMQAKQTDQAQQLFVDQVSAEKDVQKKVNLYLQNVHLALSLHNTDAALQAAQRMVAVRASYDTYAQLANVYIARGDFDQQAVYLQKTIDALKAAQNVPNKDELLANYKAQLDATNQQIQVRKTHGG